MPADCAPKAEAPGRDGSKWGEIVKILRHYATMLVALGFCSTTVAQVPQMINYQGRVIVDGANFHGMGQFKFALVDGAGTASFWSNDSTSTNGSEPAASIALTCNKGLFSVALGDTATMPSVPPSVFENSDVRIRTWFSDGGGFELLSPDQRIVAVGYAMTASSAESVAGDPYVDKSGDAMTGALRVTDGTGASGAGGHLHVGSDQANADPKLINFGDIEGTTGQGWVSIGERGADDTLEIRAQKVYFSPSGFGNYAIGIGVSNPVERLEVAGAINVGGEATAKAGNIRWTGTDFEGYDGTQWLSLTLPSPAPEPPAGMALIPAGAFRMGDPYATSGWGNERPVHTVYVSAFFMDKYEVTSNLWNEVYTWAISNGYGFDNAGTASGSNHPIHTVNWYDCVKWCNARSQKEGLTPCYYTSSTMASVWTNGQTNINFNCVNWGADGYRLPTEAEWEKAARGGLSGHHFPWPSKGGSYTNHIDGSKGNYLNSGDPYDNGTTPVGYYNGTQTPAGTDMANGYGLYDMAGNVFEWCWDWKQNAWYFEPEASIADTRGPLTGWNGYRAARSAVWSYSSVRMRCSYRFEEYPYSAFNIMGLRCVRTVQ